MLQPVSSEALGWFEEPISSMDDFRKYKFRVPPAIPGQTYNDIGVAAVAMGGGDILPALEKGTIDAAENEFFAQVWQSLKDFAKQVKK